MLDSPKIDVIEKLVDTAYEKAGELEHSLFRTPILGLLFLRAISVRNNTFHEELMVRIKNQEDDWYFDGDYLELDKHIRDCYSASGELWVPEVAAWDYLVSKAKQPTIMQLLDDSMRSLEESNPRIAGVLPKCYSSTRFSGCSVGELIDFVNSLEVANLDTVSLLSDLFIGIAAHSLPSDRGSAGYVFTTPSISNLIGAVLRPKKGVVYDPGCGLGSLLISAWANRDLRYSHLGLVLKAQEINSSTLKLCVMGLLMRGLEFEWQEGDTFKNDGFKGLGAEYIVLNPPFGKDSYCPVDEMTGDPRWVFGVPRKSPANFAWLQHVVFHLSSQGQACVVMPNGSLTSMEKADYLIRQRMIEDDVVECIITLPGKLFLTNNSPCCLWFLAKDKTKNGRDRRGETLFIDARKLGYMKDRVNRAFTEEDIQKIAQTVHLWRASDRSMGQNILSNENSSNRYSDTQGYCFSAKLGDIVSKGFSLSPSRYCGSSGDADCDEEVEFFEKLTTLVEEFKTLRCRGRQLDADVSTSLRLLGLRLD